MSICSLGPFRKRQDISGDLPGIACTPHGSSEYFCNRTLSCQADTKTAHPVCSLGDLQAEAVQHPLGMTEGVVCVEVKSRNVGDAQIVCLGIRKRSKSQARNHCSHKPLTVSVPQQSIAIAAKLPPAHPAQMPALWSQYGQTDTNCTARSYSGFTLSENE